MSHYRIHEVQGNRIGDWLDELGALRTRVFREFPYLYEGDEGYERNYLRRYIRAQDALLVLVTDSRDRLVGATTCLPMNQEEAEFRKPFEQAGFDISVIFYFGESLLLPEWRGRGIGHLFFDRREAHARKLGYTLSSFCAVDRSTDHPLRPAEYHPLDDFWKKRGYSKREDLKARFAWKEVGKAQESKQSLTFWMRHL